MTIPTARGREREKERRSGQRRLSHSTPRRRRWPDRGASTQQLPLTCTACLVSHGNLQEREVRLETRGAYGFVTRQQDVGRGCLGEKTRSVCVRGSGIQVSEGGGDGERGFGDEVTYGCGAGSSPTPALLGRNGGKSASRTVRQTGAADGLVKRP